MYEANDILETVVYNKAHAEKKVVRDLVTLSMHTFFTS